MAKAVRLDKFLADAGKGTRSEVKKFIQKGQVQVNGAPVKKPEQKVQPDDRIALLGEEIPWEPEFVYYLLHKPAGYISATEDSREHTVMELVPSARKNLFPVGRLDKDTEGLLLITDDGALAHRLLSPAKHVEKTYFVRAEGRVTEEGRRRLEEGVEIGDEKPTLPAKAEILAVYDRAEQENSDDKKFDSVSETPVSGTLSRRTRPENLPSIYTELLLTIHEGRFHQVKRMLEAVGCPVIYLKRISMGALTLPDDLKKGECRPLTAEERKSLGIA